MSEVLRKHHAEICKVLSVNSDTLKIFAGELFAKKMIDIHHKAEVIRIGGSGYDGANKLQDILMLKIEATPQLFDTIIEIMTKIDLLKDIAEKMKEKVGKLQMVPVSQSVYCTDALSTAKHLQSQFDKFLGAINVSLTNVNIDNFRIPDFFQAHHPIILKNDSQGYWTDLKNCKSAEDLFLCLKKGNLICYFNYKIVEVFLKILRNDRALNSFLEDYKREFIKLLDYNFPSIVQVFHNVQIAPATPGIGLPNFTLRIGTKCKHSNLYTLFEDVFEMRRFSWARHLLILDATLQNCILVKYAVLPFFVSSVIKDLSDPEVIAWLEHQDITIELSPLLQGMSFHVKNAEDDWLKFLEAHKLSKWQMLLEQVGITCQEELELYQGDEQVYSALSAKANELEKCKLMEMFKIKIPGEKLEIVQENHFPISIPFRRKVGLEEAISDETRKSVQLSVGQRVFLEKVGFIQYFSQKLTLQEALTISCSGLDHSSSYTTDPHKVLFIILEKIKQSNCKCRKVMLYESRVIKSAHEKSEESDSDDDEILAHPMDSLLALIYCSDSFLKQYLYLKLAESQVAVPLLLPDLKSNTLTLPLWSLRSIVKEWNVKLSDGSFSPRACRMVNCQAPLISFIRFSHPGEYSKSKILNSVMSESKHDFFFNHECEGSSVNRHFLNGLVEACWYLPSNLETNPFNDIIMFANLRGNVSHYKHQFEFISSHSCMLVVFLAENDINVFEKMIKFKTCQCLFLMSKYSQHAKRKLKALIPNCIVLELSGKEPAAVVQNIRSKITKGLSQLKGSFFRLSSIAPTQDIIIDEKIMESCERGKKLAMSIMDKIEGIDPNKLKTQLPLQGPDLWHKWASFNKKQNRMKYEEMGNSGPEQFYQKMKKEKEKVRRDQLKKNRSIVMDVFIKVLLEQPKEVTLYYFLEWLKMYLDDRSRKVLPELQLKCNIARNVLQNKHLTANEKEIIRQELKICDQKLVNASFGIEHLFRELGQMYESVMEMQKEVQPQQIQEMKQLVEVTTDLFLSGYPLEIIDGDASHIPLQWITAILENVKQKSNNAKMAVLSVLGVQSSGKSTLMNIMFGIRFAVSTGRCTRGAFFQLMKVQSTSSPNCQHLLVIDTEGLRAPELDYRQTQQHDNELAALVIGLANMTIVNINGEVAAEMNDVLQTSVHAFLRMKKVELNPSCLFVRQNVANVSGNKTLESNQRLQNQLDEMTHLAAKTENFDDQYQCFDDVITFNNETDIYNFPTLWEGNPPLAPVNPAYCEATQNLQQLLIKLFQTPASFCSIDDFKTKLKQLSKAVLKENFIFSYKNILEIEAFAALDKEYGKWSWRLENIMLKWEQSVRKSGIMPNTENFDRLKSKLVNNVIQQLDKEYERIMEDFEIFFEYSNPAIASIIKQWNARYNQKLACRRDDHIKNALKFFQNMIKENQAKAKLEEMKKNACSQLNKHLRNLVLESVAEKDGDLTKDELQDIEVKFDQHWKEWMDELNSKFPLKEQIDLNLRISACLKEKCQLIEMKSILVHELKDQPLIERIPQSTRLKLDKKYLQPCEAGFINPLFDHDVYHSDLAIVDTVTKEIYEEVQQYFLRQSDTSYDDGHILYIVQLLSQKINDSEKRFSVSLFTNQYRIDMILDVASYALKIFTTQQEEAIDNHPVKYLQSLSRQYKLQFEALCSRIAQEKKAALVLVNIVIMQLRKALEDKLILRVADDARVTNPIFTCKRDLKGKVLLRLLKKGDFKAYKIYLTDIQSSYLHWIQLFVEEHCKQCTSSGKMKLIEIAESEFKSTANVIIDAANHAYASCSENSEGWLKCFQTKLNDVISFNEEQRHFLNRIPLQGKDRVKIFTEEFVKEIREEERKRVEEPAEKNQFFNVTTIIAKAAEIICDSLAGCCEQCPFCKEQCEITDKDHKGHDHLCELHRPECLGNYDSQKMILDICTNLVQSESRFKCAATNHECVPYKEYRKVYPDWKIPDETRQIAPYWKWFTAKYKNDLVTFFDFKEADIDPDWKCLDESDAQEDVKKRYGFK